MVDANNVYDIKVNCKTGDDDLTRTCEEFTLNADNASSVTLSARGKYGFYRNNLHVQCAIGQVMSVLNMYQV